MATKTVGIVGATGLVGLEMRKLLADYVPQAKVFLFASKERPTEGILDLAQSAAQVSQCDVLLNAASSELALELRQKLLPHQILIDNSSGFRLDPEVPLVVPEVNGELLRSQPRVIANPNCTAILLTVALKAVQQWGLGRVIVSTYQAASGAGIKGLEELESQAKAVAQGEKVPAPQVFPFQLFNNVLSHNTAIHPEGEEGAGYNDEEWKVVQESRKILGEKSLNISATCIRVPVKRAHTESVTVDLVKEVSLKDLRAAFAQAPGVKVVDDWTRNHFPMPLESQNQDLVLVGRIRKDPNLAKTFHFMLSGDQIRKGAAANALQILKALWN